MLRVFSGHFKIAGMSLNGSAELPAKGVHTAVMLLQLGQHQGFCCLCGAVTAELRLLCWILKSSEAWNSSCKELLLVCVLVGYR